MSTGYQQSFSTKETKLVSKIQFSMLSKSEILAQSVAEITDRRIYDFDTMLPIKGGLNDPRMGSTNKRWICLTCEGNAQDCPGHFGHMVLAKPVYHIGFLDLCKKILSCVCFHCSKILCYKPKEIERIKKIKDGKLRIREMYKLCGSGAGGRTCMTHDDKDDDLEKKQDGCGRTQPKYILAKLMIRYKLSESSDDDPINEKNLLAEKALKIFENISDEDCKLLGFDASISRPENLILQVLPVAPPPIRPAIQMDSIARAEDDLTHQYMNILKINSEIKRLDEKGMPASQIERQVELLHFNVATLMNNEINGLPQSKHKSGRPIKSIRERLKGKEGRLRKNLMGKRVDFSARSVVSPDPNLDLDQLGVPQSIAMNLTFPETVNSLNIDRLKALVVNGPTAWPGAKHIIRNDGKTFDLRYTQNREDIQLDYGYIVERHIQDGDYVIFNRQPSLHRMSMMGHRIRILPYSSFRLNLSVTTPYNADFDGDEMNMHVPQTYETRAEIQYLMAVPKQIVSPQNNKPVMGIVQDALVGIRLFTRRSTFLNRAEVMNLLLWVDNWNGEIPPPTILKPEQLWTGKQIISLILPKINMEKICNVFGHMDQHTQERELFQRDGYVIIERGELLTGILDKGSVGNTNGGILHGIWLDFGSEVASYFLSNTQKIVNNWLSKHGFSVGASDIFPDEATSKSVVEDLSKTDLVVPELFAQAEQKKMDHKPGKSMLESFEIYVNTKLNNIFNSASKQAQNSMTDRNRVYCMVASGSKGSNLNIAQIMVCVGQQNVEGRRIPYGFHRRTLPHFCKDDYGPAGRGFVKNSYLTGLLPEEFFFHAMGGREGLIDTAVKTSETGYLQRRLIKGMEDVMVKYDNTVRDCTGNVLQFLYGEDGMAGEYIEFVSAQNFIKMDDNQMKKEFRFFDPDDQRDIADQLAEYEKYLDPSILEYLLQNPEQLTELQEQYEELLFFRSELRKILNYDKKIYLSVNVPRIIRNVKANNKSKYDQQTCKINPLDVIHQTNTMIQQLIVTKGNDPISLEAQNNGIYLLKILLKFFLNPKRICIRENLSKEVFEQILGEIESKFNTAKVHPGEMIGILCAQSIGEPTTQMTLNTFHTAGNSDRNVTLGVPRIKEILNAGRNIKYPSMCIYIKPELYNNLAESQNIAKQLQSSLEYTTLGNLTLQSELYYDPDYANTLIEDDVDMVNDYLQMPDEDDYDKVSSWLLRIVLDKIALIDRDINHWSIKEKIMSHLPDKLQIIYDSQVLPDKPVIRLRLKEGVVPQDEQVSVLRGIEQKLLEDLKLKGLPNIKKVFLDKNKLKSQDSQGKIQVNEEWFLITDGSNMKPILALDSVDHTRTTTNNCYEIYEVLGVEAARQSIIREISQILESYNIYINHRHMATLCDIMTSRGVMTSITRHGINRVIEGPFRRASFENTVEILFQAGAFSEVQQFYGITENIMFGQLAPLGTGSFKLALDIEKLKQPRYVPDNHRITNIDNEIEMAEFNQYNKQENMLNVMTTPINLDTPFINQNTPAGGMTPRTPFYDGEMTPSYLRDNFQQSSLAISPTYKTLQANNMISPTYSNSPNVFGNQSKPLLFSPSYQPTFVASPNSSTGSPKYSPQSQNFLTYSPTSPTYNSSSVSPSYSSGTGKVYSPASPGYAYSINSPQYNNNSGTYSPSSPNYTGSPLSNTPTGSSRNANTVSNSNNIYSPNQMSYNLGAPTSYNPKSPAYDINMNIQINQGHVSEEEEEYDEDEK